MYLTRDIKSFCLFLAPAILSLQVEFCFIVETGVSLVCLTQEKRVRDCCGLRKPRVLSCPTQSAFAQRCILKIYMPRFCHGLKSESNNIFGVWLFLTAAPILRVSALLSW